jgi:hypothetical protein
MHSVARGMAQAQKTAFKTRREEKRENNLTYPKTK